MPTIPKLRIGVDTGGTFTDFVHLAEDGTLTVHKLRSTPADPSQAILEGIATLSQIPCPTHRSPTAMSGSTNKVEAELTELEVTHGSTVATNAVLERRGARIALLTTAGFEDVLRIARQTRRELYNFLVEAPRPLVDPALTFGVHERLAADGAVLEPLTPEEITRLTTLLKQAGVTSVAVCLLHSYANPQHELQLLHALEKESLEVSASHRILPEYREYERFATTAVNAYVTPLMASYLAHLEQGLLQPASLRIMQSNGGSISARTAARAAVQTILSGPAAGVIGAQAIAAASGHTRIITFDMGGTSTDVALVDQTIARTNDSLVGDLPVRLPVLDIHTVGAGGGSIAWLDTGGSLRVGPRSAGADPGPACYGKGEHLTVTDANLLLGRLDPAFFLGGRMALDLPRTQALASSLAARLNLTPEALAEGILRIANANMERAIRVVSVQRGHDPRDFALLAFGGAGGLHACALAQSLDIPTVLIPQHAGVLSALGMLLADVVKDFSTSILQPTQSITEHDLHTRLQPILAEAQQALALEGFPLADILLEPTLDMRYTGQAYEISIPFEPDYRESFHRAHHKLYGYANPHRPTEIVQLRVKATGRTDKPNLTQLNSVPHSSGSHPDPGSPADVSGPMGLGEWVHPEPIPIQTRQTIFTGTPHPTPIYHQDQLPPGTQSQGPAILLTGQSTNIIPPAWTWHIDPVGTLIATRMKLDPEEKEI